MSGRRRALDVGRERASRAVDHRHEGDEETRGGERPHRAAQAPRDEAAREEGQHRAPREQGPREHGRGPGALEPVRQLHPVREEEDGEAGPPATPRRRSHRCRAGGPDSGKGSRSHPSTAVLAGWVRRLSRPGPRSAAMAQKPRVRPENSKGSPMRASRSRPWCRTNCTAASPRPHAARVLTSRLRSRLARSSRIPETRTSGRAPMAPCSRPLSMSRPSGGAPRGRTERFRQAACETPSYGHGQRDVIQGQELIRLPGAAHPRVLQEPGHGVETRRQGDGRRQRPGARARAGDGDDPESPEEDGDAPQVVQGPPAVPAREVRGHCHQHARGGLRPPRLRARVRGRIRGQRQRGQREHHAPAEQPQAERAPCCPAGPWPAVPRPRRRLPPSTSPARWGSAGGPAGRRPGSGPAPPDGPVPGAGARARRRPAPPPPA